MELYTAELNPIPPMAMPAEPRTLFLINSLLFVIFTRFYVRISLMIFCIFRLNRKTKNNEPEVKTNEIEFHKQTLFKFNKLKSDMNIRL